MQQSNAVCFILVLCVKVLQLQFFSTVRLARGLISVEEYGGEVSGFRDYFLSRDPENNTENPWITQYWEQINNCTFPLTCSER